MCIAHGVRSSLCQSLSAVFVYLKFPVIIFVLFLLSVKKDLLGPLYFFLFNPIHISQVSRKSSSPVVAHVQHKTVFVDCLASEGPCPGLRDAVENDRASGRGNSLLPLPWYKGSFCFFQLLELLWYCDKQIYEGQSYKIEYCG